MVRPLFDKKRLARLTGSTLAGYMNFVHRWSRVIVQPADPKAFLTPLSPGICALWHGQFLLCPVVHVRELPLSIMVAQHGDAEFLAEALVRFDMDLIRGAGAGKRLRDRDGARAFVAAAKRLAGGRSVAMTADIPPGPARVAGTGIVKLAQVSGRPIVPLAVATSRYHAFHTWSRMTLNLPFGTLAAVYGQPIWVPRNGDAAALERTRRAVEHELNAATSTAYRLAGADPARATPPNQEPCETTRGASCDPTPSRLR
jgi:3-deoxy-D-manno-octulosonic-acid transferase